MKGLRVLAVAFLVLELGVLTPTFAQTAADPVTRTFSAPLVLQALRNSYPGLLSNIRLVVGSWEFDVAGQTFAWAEGRLLPKDRAGQWLSFSPQPFYQYTSKSPAVDSWTRDQELAVEKQLRTRNNTKILRDGAIFDALWGIRNRGDADDQQKRLSLFGLPVTVHEKVAFSLKKVEATLQASTDKETKPEAARRVQLARHCRYAKPKQPRLRNSRRFDSPHLWRQGRVLALVDAAGGHQPLVQMDLGQPVGAAQGRGRGVRKGRLGVGRQMDALRHHSL